MASLNFPSNVACRPRIQDCSAALRAEREVATIFDFVGLLRTIANGHSNQGVEIAVSGPDHAPFHGCPFALKRAFTNLIGDAMKYGGAPEVSLSCESASVTVRVCDSGVGVPADAIESGLAPFVRLERSRNRATGGVGLGLTFARGVIRGYGGRVLRNRVTRRPEAETTFSVAGWGLFSTQLTTQLPPSIGRIGEVPLRANAVAIDELLDKPSRQQATMPLRGMICGMFVW